MSTATRPPLPAPHPLPAGLRPGCEAERFVRPSPAARKAVAYRTHTTLGPTDAAAPLCAPGASVPVSHLLPR